MRQKNIKFEIIKMSWLFSRNNIKELNFLNNHETEYVHKPAEKNVKIVVGY